MITDQLLMVYHRRIDVDPYSHRGKSLTRPNENS